jgi:putative ABC transport system permease protein
MRTLWRDLAYGFRVLVKNPGFAVAAVVVLALGIGANTAIFSVVNAALLRPLPFQDPDRLVQVYHVPPAKSFPGMTRFAVSPANYLDWARQNDVFDHTAIYTYSRLDLSGGDKPESLTAGVVEHTFFSVFGVQPILGRTFLPEEDQPGQSHEVVLGYELWQSHFGSDRNIVGRSITLNDESYTVLGVMGPHFRRPDFVQIWTPLGWTDQERAIRGNHNYLVVARLKPGTTLKQAQADMDTISRGLEQQYPADDKGWGATVVPIREDLVGNIRPALLVLLGAVGFVLLIACANISNLVLARAMMRRKEMAIRSALGASRSRIVQQVLSETVLLGVAGGLLGLALATQGVKWMASYLAAQLPPSIEIRPDLGVLVFTLAISVVTGILAGLLPALRFSRGSVNDMLKQGLGRTDADAGSHRSLKALVTAEVALSLMLLVGAGLMIRSLWNLRHVDPGLDPRNVITMQISVPPQKLPSPQQYNAFFQQVVREVRSLPGIDSAGLIDSLPLSGGGSTQPVAIEGRPAAAMADQPEVGVRVVSPDYLPAMRVPLLRGRMLTEADTADSPLVVLISQSMAARFWPNQNPVGKHLTLTFFPGKVREIAGVVGDVKDSGLDAGSQAMLYFPAAQISAPPPRKWRSFPLTLAVRANSSAATAVPEIASAIHHVDPTAPVLKIATMEQVVSDSLLQRRFTMWLLAAFAGLALVLAAVGIYGVLAYAVRRRVPEIGIRMALGARPGDVTRMVVRDGLRPTLIGVAIGLVGALGLGRVVASLVFGVKSTDPVTLGVVSLLLAAVAFVASIVPAYRAAKIDPIQALRNE